MTTEPRRAVTLGDVIVAVDAMPIETVPEPKQLSASWNASFVISGWSGVVGVAVVDADGKTLARGLLAVYLDEYGLATSASKTEQMEILERGRARRLVFDWPSDAFRIALNIDQELWPGNTVTFEFTHSAGRLVTFHGDTTYGPVKFE